MKKINIEKLVVSKNRKDRAAKWSSLLCSWLFSLIFLCLIAFIIYASVPGFVEYGFKNVFGTFTYDLSVNKASIWLPLCVTMMTAALAILIGAPIGIKTATFIKFRLSVKYQKSVRIFVELLADIPSVIFGLFAIQSLGRVIALVFGMSTVYNLVTSGFMLAFMILPTIISLTLNAYDGVDANLISAPMVLGNTKTMAIYKAYKKQARSGITIAIIIAIARAIGETMAISMILQSQSYNSVFNQGFIAIWASYLKTLGALIASNMFAESGSQALQGLLFGFGLFLFVFVMILNMIAFRLTKPKIQTRYRWVNKIQQTVGDFILFIPLQIKVLYYKIVNKNSIKITERNLNRLSDYYSNRAKNNVYARVSYSSWKLFWEYICAILTMGFIVWIVGDILIYGIIGITSPSASLISMAKGSTGQALVNTLLIIFVAIGIGLPLALIIAIYINEFSPENSKARKILLFFIDSLGATPSILFGMFGMIFFIQILGMTSSGAAGKSLIAGALTILIVILPTFIRTIQQALQTIAPEIRISSYALGAGKWETIRKIILPASLKYIMTAIVLAIGRILAETAPLYLTAGLGSSSSVSLTSPGQTLTTRIYAQIYTNNYTDATNIMFECAFVTLILVSIILILVHVIIPKYFMWRHEHSKTKISTKKFEKKYKPKIESDFKKIKTHKTKNKIEQKKLLFLKHLFDNKKFNHKFQFSILRN